MPIVYTGLTHGGSFISSGIISVTFSPVAIAAGEAIILSVVDQGGTPLPPTDNATPSSNTYVQIGTTQNFGAAGKLLFWMCLSSKSAVTSITVKSTGVGRKTLAVDTWTGVLAFNIANVASSTGATSPASLTLGSGMASGSVMAAVFGDYGTGTNIPTWLTSTGNLRHNKPGSSSSANGAAIVDSTTTTCAAGMSANTTWAGIAVEMTAIPSADTNNTHNIDASAALDETSSHIIDASVALDITGTHEIDASAALDVSDTHEIDASAALDKTYSHSVDASAALDVSYTHEIDAVAFVQVFDTVSPHRIDAYAEGATPTVVLKGLRFQPLLGKTSAFQPFLKETSKFQIILARTLQGG
jgi:hypothetical protein